jgi:2,5-diketo-D-gluconate reductase A
MTTSTSQVPAIPLRGGAAIPQLGFGVFQVPPAQTVDAVAQALAVGYRHIDTAAAYGNEAQVGEAIRASGLDRSEVFLTTKCWNDDQGYEEAKSACRKSLERLALDYVDLYLIHWPLPLRSARLWRDLESLQERGLTREIGVSNFGTDRLRKLIRGPSRVPAVDQVQFSPFRYRRRLLEYCLEQGIVFEAYSPLERGQGIHDPTIAAVAERLGRTPAQVMLRWAIQRQAVVIPKSSRKERIRSNAELFDFELADSDMRNLDALDRTGGSARARG